MNYLDDKTYWKRKFDDDRRIQIENQNQNQNQNQNNYNPNVNIVHKTNLQNTTIKNENNINKKLEFLKKELNTYKKLYYEETKKNEKLSSELYYLKADLDNRNIKLSKIHKIIN